MMAIRVVSEGIDRPRSPALLSRRYASPLRDRGRDCAAILGLRGDHAEVSADGDVAHAVLPPSEEHIHLSANVQGLCKHNHDVHT